jgi:hypothetical protein
VGSKFDKPPLHLASHSALKGWILDWIGREKEEKIAWAFFTLYNLWSVRNDAREYGVIAVPVSIVRRSVEGVAEWWNIHHPNKLKSPSVKEH